MNYIVTYQPQRWYNDREDVIDPCATVETVHSSGDYAWDGARLKRLGGDPSLPRRNPLRARVIEAMRETLRDGKRRVVRP
jgi:hypothetical protein